MLNINDLISSIKKLLEEFRSGTFLDSYKEGKIVKAHLEEIDTKWNQNFSNFPERKKKKGTIGWKLEKSKRSTHLINILTSKLKNIQEKNNIIINPACYTGKCAQQIAVNLPRFEVIGTDINPKYEKYYRFFQKLAGKKQPENYKFIVDDIFNSKLNIHPEATVFFGACGSVTDAIMDYAIKINSPFLVCRTCCHDNIGGNTHIEKKSSLLNLGFRYKNHLFKKIKEGKKGDYFSDTYSKNSYPRSNAVKSFSSSEEYMKIAQNSVDSVICEALIDLDRCCYLIEHGYDVLYKDELFFARKQ